MKTIQTSLFTLLLICFTSARAQEKKAEIQAEKFSDLKVNVLFGMNQLLLNGFNSEVNLIYKRFIFDYSHGVSLNLDNAILDPTNRDLGVDVHIPWTTGFGLGYFFNNWFNLRVEPKWHKFELYNMGEDQEKENLLADYTTFSLGIGAYANFQPFKKSENFLKGIMIVPSIRWWPRLSSSLDNNQLEIQSKELNQKVNHDAMEVGISNSPLIVNISVGYSF